MKQPILPRAFPQSLLGSGTQLLTTPITHVLQPLCCKSSIAKQSEETGRGLRIGMAGPFELGLVTGLWPWWQIQDSLRGLGGMALMVGQLLTWRPLGAFIHHPQHGSVIRGSGCTFGS